MMQKPPKIMIIGGAATALALHQAGFDVTVYERACELKEVGAGIALWANATHVLKIHCRTVLAIGENGRISNSLCCRLTQHFYEAYGRSN
ncbi:hypothetical protein H6G33_16615 [Calothrix sp. FACHB-1219]|uniref:hypothetical protein n=1 Tax=unclassified Calothrix TaxID=2619626 RepID=UPI001688A7CD|nr:MULTISPECIES: hypothetical protein [unclassified Calothrix]MBD2203056.1 hypothetical protein [Calothrix sp. FACHB-168]MBD2218657.1 hypothetical protein [Calothrix sp. FACHB-1219]